MPLMLWMQWRHVGLGPVRFLKGMVPSALVALACALACMAMQALMPASLPSWARLLALAPALALIWYSALRLTRHELLDEVHRLGVGLRTRLAG